MSDKVPDWVKDEAGKIADIWQHPMHHDHQIMHEDISAALLSAYRRGQTEHVDLIDRLDAALCQFLNNAADAYDPEVWVPSIKRDFAALSEVYNECHKAGLMQINRSAATIRRLGEAE